MKKLFALLIPLLFIGFITTSEIQAQDGQIAQVYEMTPIFGHTDMVAEAIREHVKWRKENGDSWSWDIFQVITGENMNSFFARSGFHTWAELDDTYVEGAIEHFNETVMPHLADFKSSITQGIPSMTNMGGPEDLNLYQVVFYDVIPRRQQDMMQATAKFSEIVTEKMPHMYHAFANIVAGGDGSRLMGVFPRANWAAFDGDEEMEKVLLEELGPEGMQELYTQFTSSIRGERNFIAAHRKDLSTNWVE